MTIGSYFRKGLYNGDQVNMMSLKESLIQDDTCLCEKRKYEARAMAQSIVCLP